MRMREKSDSQLLRETADRGHEPAFREIVTWHTDSFFLPHCGRCKSIPNIKPDPEFRVRLVVNVPHRRGVGRIEQYRRFKSSDVSVTKQLIVSPAMPHR